MKVVVDRIENGIAVLEDDAQRIYHVSAANIAGAREGDVLRIELAGDEVISCFVDSEETLRRRERAKSRLRSLFNKNN